MNEFCADTHEYKMSGRKVFSVTQIIKGAGLYGEAGNFYNAASAEKGKFIHEACELYDKGDLEEQSLDEKLVPYLDAWKAFRKQMPVEFAVIEQPFFSLEHGFAGTIDRAWFENKKGVVADIKTGAVPDWVSIQLAGYAILFPSLTAMAIQLKDNGKFSLQPFGLMEMARARCRFMEALDKVRNLQ